MPPPSDTGRANQRHRTRKDLLAAAGRLLKTGQAPDMDAVAKEAMVSRATAYRYFPSVEALLTEAPLDGAVPEPHALFDGDRSTDPIDRLEKAEAALHEVTFHNEQQLRAMLIASVQRVMAGQPTDGIPIRQNRRAGLIAAALAPAKDRFTPANYQKLTAALSLVFGTESMIVFKDVLNVDEKTARRVKSWAIGALVNAAMRESR